jgi:acyl transferase domain-containing protein
MIPIADGYSPGEAIVCMLLQKSDLAAIYGHTIQAIICSSVNQSGKKDNA